jgi:hypothetical protein
MEKSILIGIQILDALYEADFAALDKLFSDEKPGSDELDSIKREIRKFKKERGIK